MNKYKYMAFRGNVNSKPFANKYMASYYLAKGWGVIIYRYNAQQKKYVKSMVLHA